MDLLDVMERFNCNWQFVTAHFTISVQTRMFMSGV